MLRRSRIVTSLVLLLGPCVAMLAQSSAPDNSSASASIDQSKGVVTGLVLDPTGASVVGASVRLVQNSQTESAGMNAMTGPDGRFILRGVGPGTFHLVISATGFAAGAAEGTLPAGETCEVPAVSLALASATTNVKVTFTDHDLAAEQIKAQENQRFLSAIPNFYVSYVPNAVPLTSKQKFSLAWKQTIDPSGFVVTGIIAGAEQDTNAYKGYGQGAEGYAKRYGAAYADYFIGVTVTNAVLPSLFKQDPRYFYKGTGTVNSRILYALANSVICKGDNHRWQVNYSSILGNLAAGGISNLYYPAADRNGATLSFENAGIGIGAQAVANLLQEFLFRKLTTNTRGHKAVDRAN